MTVWKVFNNNFGKGCILIDENNNHIFDPSIYYKEKQSLPIPDRRIRFLDDNALFFDITNYLSTSGAFIVNDRTKIILERNFKEIQFFPAITTQYPDKKFWILNAFNYQDVLDVSHCEYETIQNRKGDTVITNIRSYAFTPNVQTLDIFKIIVNGRRNTLELFVTDKFKSVIEENNITGLNLIKVYEM